MILEHTRCSRSLQGTQVKETGRYLQARDLLAFLNRGQMFARDHSLGFHRSLLTVEKDVQILDLAQMPIP